MANFQQINFFIVKTVIRFLQVTIIRMDWIDFGAMEWVHADSICEGGASFLCPVYHVSFVGGWQ